MKAIGVDCTFTPEGDVRVRRVALDGQWQAVGQGRQWLDDDGRHVLIMFHEQRVAEILLRADTMRWELRQQRGASREIWAV
jgi:hypothetical protein